MNDKWDLYDRLIILLGPFKQSWCEAVTDLDAKIHLYFDRISRSVLGDTLLGALDYWLFPGTRDSWGGPFNGQAARRRLFLALIDKFAPSAILETGTYRGTTTEFMAETGLPIFTIESSRRLYGYSRMRLYQRSNVKVLHGDSRKNAEELLRGPLRELKHRTIFAYLDAHWEHDLPLAEELDIIFSECHGAIVMIDDFEVPTDTGYRYDRYKSGKALTRAHIASMIEKHALVLVHPSTPSSQETGSKRGCAVLGINSIHGAQLRGMELLRSI